MLTALVPGGAGHRARAGRGSEVAGRRPSAAAFGEDAAGHRVQDRRRTAVPDLQSHGGRQAGVRAGRLTRVPPTSGRRCCACRGWIRRSRGPFSRSWTTPGARRAPRRREPSRRLRHAAPSARDDAPAAAAQPAPATAPRPTTVSGTVAGGGADRPGRRGRLVEAPRRRSRARRRPSTRS